jgi:membrane protein implicated in regulation of membrane protease activity
MQGEIHDWHWLVFGMLLMLAEIFIPSFTIFWFGLGAVVVAGLLWLMPGLSLTWQLFLWAVASSLFTFLWFKLIKPRMTDRTKAGIAREAVLGESGSVIRVPEEGRRGMVRFSAPLLGNDEWPFICEQKVMTGDRVFVKDVSGNTLIVEKRQTQ